MKRVFLILLFPFLVAFQCDDDDIDTGFETAYIINNQSSVDLFFLDREERFIEIGSQTQISIGSTLNQEAREVLPAASFLFNSIRLYRSENGDFLLSYSQDPIEDGLWVLTEPQINRFEYTLVITDADLN